MTVNVKVVVRLTEPAVAVSVIGHVPKGAEVPALIVKVVLHVGKQLVGLNDAVTPVGRPDALNATV